MKLSARCFDRSGRRLQDVVVDRSHDPKLAPYLKFLKDINVKSQIGIQEKVERIRALRQIGRVFGRELAGVVLGGGKVVASFDLGPVQLSEILLHGSVEVWSEGSVHESVCRFHRCGGEFYEQMLTLGQEDDNPQVERSKANVERIGIVIVRDKGPHTKKMEEVLSASTASGVMIEVITGRAPARWRRPDLIVVGHSQEPGFVESVAGPLSVKDIVEAYGTRSRWQLDLCACKSRDAMNSDSFLSRGCIRARSGFVRFDRIYESIVDMLVPKKVIALLNDNKFSYLDGRVGFATVRNLVYLLNEADVSLEITKRRGWSDEFRNPDQ